VQNAANDLLVQDLPLTDLRWHVTALPSSDKTEGIDHAVMGFAPSKTFNSGSSFTPFESPDSMRKRFGPDTKLMIAIGGWGDTEGFSEAAKTEASRERYAKNVASMLESNGFDGVGKMPSITPPYSEKAK
jgi:chitinase